MKKQEICAVLCMQSDGGIGKDNKLLYSSRKEIIGDMQRFVNLTTGKVVIMGRKTWESLPDNFKPLPDRINIVVSRQPNYQDKLPSGVMCFDDIGKAITFSGQAYFEKDIAIIGGAEIYEATWHLCDTIHTTEVDYKRPADTFVKLPENLKEISRERKESENGIVYHFVDYEVIKNTKPLELEKYEVSL